MKQSHFPTKLSPASLLTATAVFISRLNFLPANVSPLGSFGFFGHPIMFAVSIVMFDLAIKGVYPGVLLTYLGFACYPLLGWLSRKQVRFQLLALPTASFLFFLISNFGVWWHWYDHTWGKLFLCYSLAVPFYARTLLSDVVFGYGYLFYLHRHELTEKLQLSIFYPIHLTRQNKVID